LQKQQLSSNYKTLKSYNKNINNFNYAENFYEYIAWNLAYFS